MFTRMQFNTPPNASPAVLRLSFLPIWGETCRDFVLRLQIGADGVPADVRVLRGTNEATREEAIETVKSWRFKPASLNRLPVASSAEVALTCEPWPAPSQGSGE